MGSGTQAIKEVYSRVSPTDLVAVLYKLALDLDDSGRSDFLESDSILQVARIALQEGSLVRAHKHLPVERRTRGTQEVWIVIKGNLVIELFDLDNSSLGTFGLEAGDVAITLIGGHAIVKATSNTILYEVKNGPYLGGELDRVSI